MNKVSKSIRRWCYHWLYYSLFKFYSKKLNFADSAGLEAAKAFRWLTGEEWYNQLH